MLRRFESGLGLVASLRKLKRRFDAFARYDDIVEALGTTLGLRATFRALERYVIEYNRRQALPNWAKTQAMYTKQERRKPV